MSNEPRPYQVCLYVGSEAPQIEGVKVVDLTPADASVEAVLQRFKDSKLSPADLRARVFFQADGDVSSALAVYSALLGFAGRRIDVARGEDIVPALNVDEAARSLRDTGRPAETIEQIQVSPTPHAELPTITPAAAPTPAEVTQMRYAKRVRFVPPAEQPAYAALFQLLVLAGVRARRDDDRLPYLCVGDEPVLTGDEAGDAVGLDLDAVRREAKELRRSMRFDDRGAIAERVEPGDRQRYLMAAAAVPIEDAMSRLGARQDEERGLWHCPRPERHTNGDRNPSMRVVKGKVQCMRCDPERVDSLRLVMNSRSLSVDEAADWLLKSAS